MVNLTSDFGKMKHVFMANLNSCLKGLLGIFVLVTSFRLSFALSLLSVLALAEGVLSHYVGPQYTQTTCIDSASLPVIIVFDALYCFVLLSQVFHLSKPSRT